MPRNDAAAPGHVCPGIRIHAIDIVQPPGIGKAGAHSLAAVLARARLDLDGFPVTDIADRFLASGHDLILEAGDPAAFRALVPPARDSTPLTSASCAPRVEAPGARWASRCARGPASSS